MSKRRGVWKKITEEWRRETFGRTPEEEALYKAQHGEEDKPPDLDDMLKKSGFNDKDKPNPWEGFTG